MRDYQHCNGAYDLVAAELDRVHERIAGRFTRAEPDALTSANTHA